MKNKLYLIEVYTFGSEGEKGPSKFIKGLKDILPYNSMNICSFVDSQNRSSIKGKMKIDFCYYPTARFDELFYNKLITTHKINRIILGPIFVPLIWELFPNKNIWYEKRFPEILKSVKGIGVHSIRVRNYLSKKANTMDKINKFIIIRPCTNLAPKKVRPFNSRTFDILLFEKYADLNRSQQADQLYKLFNDSSKKIVKLVYGNYTQKLMKKLANDSKFIIYFSFYDTGAIGLKEIQNYGVFTFTHQKEFAISKDSSFYIPELAYQYSMKPAYQKIIGIIKNVSLSFPNSQQIASKNQEINKCQKALDDLCKSLY